MNSMVKFMIKPPSEDTNSLITEISEEDETIKSSSKSSD